MFLKTLSRFLKSLSGRLAVSYFLFFALGSSVLFGVLFFSVAKYLEQKDHDIIEARFQEYQSLFERDGVQGIQKIISSPKLHAQSARFLIYVKDQQQHSVFLHFPEEVEKFDLNEVQSVLSRETGTQKVSWFNIASKGGDEDALEVRSSLIENGYTLSVGSSTDNRDDTLDNMREVYMGLLVPLLLISAAGAFLIARRALRPIRQLIRTATQIKNGDLSSRVRLHDSEDELYELSNLFNEMIERVEGLVTAMTDTLDNVAHDLKTPITRLKIAGELALQSKDPGQMRTALAECIENGDEILQLIKTIMTVSELNAKTVHPHLSSFDFTTLVQEVIEVYLFVAEDKEIQVSLREPSEPLIIEADRRLLKQAVANLLDNSLKYSHRKSLVEISLIKNTDEVILEIQDHGIGISEADLPRIWERLFRADKSRTEPGLGLGLSMVRAIVESHKGRVEVKSTNEVGSTFRIAIPSKSAHVIG
jgi:signal transduction histidine kinase